MFAVIPVSPHVFQIPLIQYNHPHRHGLEITKRFKMSVLCQLHESLYCLVLFPECVSTLIRRCMAQSKDEGLKVKQLYRIVAIVGAEMPLCVTYIV
jgi:hypothetical protein